MKMSKTAGLLSPDVPPALGKLAKLKESFQAELQEFKKSKIYNGCILKKG